jgi:hypothetical protein
MWQLSLLDFQIDSAFTRGNLRDANKDIYTGHTINPRYVFKYGAKLIDCGNREP